MAISRQKKEEILADLLEKVKSSKSIFFAKNLGLSVDEAQKMRRALRDGGNAFRVAKKTLIKKAAKDVQGIEITDETLEGAAGAAFALEDELSAVKILAKFAKETEKIEITGGIFEGKILSKEDAITLSKIPSREELLAKLLGSLNSPISGFVGVGSQVLGGFVRATNAYREQKEAAA